MKTAIVSITSSPVKSFIPITGEESVQIARSLVQIENETPAEHISIWSSGELILLNPSEGLLRKLKASNPAAMVSFVVKDSEGYSAVVSEDKVSLNSFPIAASIAVIKASWGWDESDAIIVRVNDAEFRIHARYDGDNWIASEQV